MLRLFTLITLLGFSFSVKSQECVDPSLINLDAVCFDLYAPVCGCDGITYSNSCYAVNFGGVTSYISGPCANDVEDAEPCTDLADVDFGQCDMFVGFGVMNGECVGISGCGWEVDGVNYQPAIYGSIEDCQACLENPTIDAEPCTDMADVDFGPCSMFMGIGIINGECTAISGCGWEVDGINYQPAFYSTMEACETCLESNNLLNNNQFHLNAYPIPAHQTVRIESSSEIQELLIMTTSGVVVHKEKTQSTFTDINTSNWTSGFYLLQIQTSLGAKVVKIQVK